MSRVVMYVYNEATNDSRVLKEAASLARAGHEVTLVARTPITDPPDVQHLEGDGFAIVRVPVPRGWRRTWTWFRYPWRARAELARLVKTGVRHPGPHTARAAGAIALSLLALPWIGVRLIGYAGARRAREPRRGDDTLDWLARWRWGILGWADAAAAAAPVAEVHHGHDLTGLAAAVRAARRDSAVLVYDSHELYLDSGSNAPRPRWARAILSRLERRWADRAAALVTVNQALADRLSSRLRIARIAVVHNCPARWTPPVPAPDPLREAAAIPASAPIALYHGGFWPHRGIEQLAEAILEPGMEQVHAVALGYGSRQPELEALASEARFGGRLHVLAAVPPDVLPLWINSADVGVLPIQPSTLNHVLSTPNKLFECMAAGVPVVASDFPEIRRIVADDPDGPLGVVCDPTDPTAIARAIRAIVEADPTERAALRARCLRAAHARWNWESESARLLELYADLIGDRSVKATVAG